MKSTRGRGAPAQDPSTVLELVREIRISDLVRSAGDTRFEASGVFFLDDYLHIIFDDDSRLLRIRPDWQNAGGEPVLLDLKGTGAGYEDITFQPSAHRWYCLIEAAKTKSGVSMPRVDEFDESFAFMKSSWMDFPLKAGNKGFEGLASLRSAGNDYLLGLCEGNNCKGGSAGSKPGKGRIQAFTRGEETWEHAGTIRLPEAVRFLDYSSLDLRDARVTVLSQASSALWVGRLRAQPDGLQDFFEDDGRVLLFPRDDKDRIQYCNLEGVSWLGNDRLVVVSDKGKDDQPKRCARKEQSIHVFDVPPGGLS